MVFKKGQSGNPLGGALPIYHKKRVAANALDKFFEKATEIIGSKLDSGDPDQQEWAAKMVYEYVCGKASQSVEVSGEGGGPLIAVIKDE